MQTLIARATSQKVRPTSPPNSLNTMPTAKRPNRAKRPIMKIARNMMFSDAVKVTKRPTIMPTSLFHERSFSTSDGSLKLPKAQSRAKVFLESVPAEQAS